MFLPILLPLLLLLVLRQRTCKNSITNILPPGPKHWPLIGNLPQLLRNKPRFRWVQEAMKEANSNISCIKIGKVHIILVQCPMIAREFLKTHDRIFASRPETVASEYLSFGYKTIAVTPWGDQWKKMRSVVTSELLNARTLKWLEGKRNEEADNLVKYVYSQCLNKSSGIVNLRNITRSYCGNVMRKLMFNTRYFGREMSGGGPGFQEEEHMEALFTIHGLLYSFCVSDYLPYLRKLDWDGHEKILRETMKIISKYHDGIIDQRIHKWRETGLNRINRGPDDLLDLLISCKDAKGEPLLSADEIKGQIVELFLASVDNPSNAVEWALAEMMNQPHIIRKAVDEIDRVVGKERFAQESDLSKLNYVKAIVREAFRLHPVSPFNIPHVSIADATVAGYFIPKGSQVLLNRYGLGRNPRVWEDALVFKPERHLHTGSGNVELNEPDLRFVSFSTGRRGCMGVSLGSVMTIMLLTRLLQGFDWSLPPGQPIIDLLESPSDLFLAEPLHGQAKPRLPSQMYKVLK